MLTLRLALRGRALVSGLAAVAVVGPLILLAPVPAIAVVSARPPGGSYEALTPARMADTRTGLGGVPYGPTRSLVVSTAGRAGVPARGVSAVAVNITIRPGSVSGFVTAYPTGSPRPPTSNMNFARRQTVAQMAVVSVNGSGQFTIEASAPAHFVVDVEGYFTSADAASTRGLFNPVAPERIMDSRSGTRALGPGSTAVLQVTGRAGVPPTGVSAVVINTTIAGPTSAGFVTDYPTGSTRPVTSTLNFAPGQTVANRAIVPVGTGGTISIYNDSGMTRPVIDVSGYFTDGAAHLTGGYYVPVTSSRVVDTRYWQTTSYLSTRTLKTQKIAGQRCVLSPARTLCGRALVPPVTAAQRPIAALLNMTAVPRGGSGYLTAFPAGSPIPSSSDVSYTSSTVASNIAFVGLGSRGEVSVQNSGGPADVVEDVSGYFVLPAVALPPARVTKAVALKIPGSGSRLLRGRGGATVAAPAFFATTGRALPASSRTSVGGTGTPSAQLTRPSASSSSAAVTQRSMVPLAGTAPVTSFSPTTPLQAAPSITRLSQAAPPVARLSQAAPPVARLSQAAPSVARTSQAAAPATSFSQDSAQAHCRRHAGHQDDESHPMSGR